MTIFTVFNRRELVNTFAFDRQAQVRDILRDNNIPYRCRVIRQTTDTQMSTPMMMRSGTREAKLDMTAEHKIYVLRKDYDRAKALIR